MEEKLERIVRTAVTIGTVVASAFLSRNIFAGAAEYAGEELAKGNILQPYIFYAGVASAGYFLMRVGKRNAEFIVNNFLRN